MSLYTGSIDEQGNSGAAKWIVGFLLAAVLACAFGALQVYLLTTESTALEAHRRMVNALAEGDAVIQRDYETWQQTAEASEPGTAIDLPNWPVQITVTHEELLNSTPESLRALLLERSASTLYDEGTSALRNPDATGDPGRFTASGLVDTFMDVLTGRVHTASLVALVALLVLALAIGAWLMAVTRGYGRIVALGVAVIAGALPVLLAGATLSAYMRVSLDSNTEYLRAEMLRIGQDLAMVPLLSGLAFGAAGLALVVVGAVAARLSGASASSGAFDRGVA